MEKYKKSNKRILIIFICLLTIIAIFNVVMDPYNVFMSPDLGFNSLKPEAKRQERLTKVIGLKLDKRKLDSIFIGTSRVDWAINKQHYKEITGKETESMAVVGLGFDEYLDLARLCLKLHPEVKKIYMGLDLYTFNKNFKGNKQTIPFNKNKYLTTQELATVLFAGDTTVSSFITLFRNVLPNSDKTKLYTRMGTTYRFNNKLINVFFRNAWRKYYELYDEYEFNNEYYDKLQTLKSDLKKQGVDLIFFHTTGHITDIDVIYETGMWNTFTKWKKDLTKISDIYDFYYYNDVNNCEITPDIQNFTDAAHASDLTGKKIIATLTGSNNNYGRLNTAENVDKYMKEDLKNLLNWRKKNPDLVKKVQDEKSVYKKLKEAGEL